MAEEMAKTQSVGVCILGCDDYAELCGAIAVSAGMELFGNTSHVEFHGVRLFKSLSKKRGIMFS